MPPVWGGALIKGLAKMLTKPPYNALTAPLPQIGSEYIKLTGWDEPTA